MFGKSTNFKTPVVESTGSGGGLKLFCSGIGTNTPDITNASRQIKNSEKKNCKTSGVTPIEYMIGYDGIVVGQSKETEVLNLTTSQLYKAVAAKIYVDGKFINNPYNFWSDIDSSLPNREILIYGPPPTSGTRDAFIELVNEHVCRKELKLDKETTKANCLSVREDGRFIEAGENDNLIVQKLMATPEAVGIFGYSFLENNLDKIVGSVINGNEPTFDNISNGSYTLSRSLFFYVKKEHLDVIPGLEEFVSFFMSERIIGEDGAAIDKGLIPK